MRRHHRDRTKVRFMLYSSADNNPNSMYGNRGRAFRTAVLQHNPSRCSVLVLLEYVLCVCVCFLCSLQGITTAALALSTLLRPSLVKRLYRAFGRICSVCFCICTRLQFFVEFVTRIPPPSPYYQNSLVGIAVQRNCGQMRERAMCSTNLSR